MPSKIILLESVGSAINMETMLVHSIRNNRTIDMNVDEAISFFDLDDEWFAGLSHTDAEIVRRMG